MVNKERELGQGGNVRNYMGGAKWRKGIPLHML